MRVNIRKAKESDFATIISMVHELAKFEQAKDKVTNTAEQMAAEQSYFHCLIAEDENKQILGIALYFFAYYTWVGKSLYLDDLYVKEEFRGQKIGSKLLQSVQDIAVVENCKRIRWQVLNWNKPAIDFYKKWGAVIDGEWYNCDINFNE